MSAIKIVSIGVVDVRNSAFVRTLARDSHNENKDAPKALMSFLAKTQNVIFT